MGQPYAHAPADYDCPFCKVTCGGQTQRTTQDDVLFRNETVTAFMASKNWPNNKGHVLVVPTAHFENVFDMPPELGTPFFEAVQRVAYAMKAVYHCEGISTRQHNEPAGNQDVWHFHIHVHPRYKGDFLYLTRGRNTVEADRWENARKLREWLQGN